MSSGHHHGGADDLNTEIATPEFILRCAALIAAATVNSDYDVPYLANRSTDYARVYKDRRVPDVLPITGVDTRKSLPWHELPEALAMDDGLAYQAAHATVATPLERKEVERQKPNDPNIWIAYTEEMDGYIRAVADETIEIVPDDLDLRVYEDESDQKVLKEIMAAERAMSNKQFFRTTAAPDLANSSGRLIRYRFSTPEVGRDQHIISAWKLDNFRQNPVFLWAHMGKEPPIGKVVELEDVKGYLTGSVEYAERDLYPFADTIFQLVRGGYINAVSTSWDPIEWKYSTDRARPGGIDFRLVDLLELSQVPVPALPTALATARAAGIDVAPVREWAERILDEGGMILVPRTEIERLRQAAGGSIELPSFLPPRKAPSDHDVADTESKMNKSKDDKRAAKLAAFKRDLYLVSWAAYLLSDLDSLQTSVAWEAAIEEDSSPIPAQLAAIKKSLGDVLVAMVGEEVAELLNEDDEADAGTAGDIVDGPRAKRAALATLRSLKAADKSAWPALRQLAAAAQRGEQVALASGDAVEMVRQALARIGKALSAKNEQALRDVHNHFKRGCDMLGDVIDEATGSDGGDLVDDGSDDNSDDDSERAVRERKAKALKRKLGLVA